MGINKIPFSILLPLLIMLFLAKSVLSQSHIDNNRCAHLHTEKVLQFEKWINSNSISLSKSEETYQIPIVIHVIHFGEPLGEGFNISSEQVESQVRILNEDFRRKEGTRGFNNHPSGEDAKIEFVLARSSPDGEATDGIVRVDLNQFAKPSFGGSMVALGAYYSIWDTYQYLNIWAFPGFQDTGLGDAIFPNGDLPGLDENEIFIPGIDSINGIAVKDLDGVAINSVHFGELDINSAYNLGRTATHEVGHFLGLYHIWGDQGFEGKCEIDDYCEDTPNVSTRTSGCPTNKLACDGSKAMIENYMDYTDDACMNIFTSDQVTRMRTVLENSPRRKSLLISKGLHLPDEVLEVSDLLYEPSIYPNPYKEQLYVDLPYEQNETKIEVQYYNLTGELLGTDLLVGITPSKVIELDPPSIGGGGMLILKLILNEQAYSYRIVKE